jgi:tRNA pseudouridine38-40 synthase
MRNIRMMVAYVGTRFAGWQIQPGRRTIQGELERRISAMLNESVRITGAGRTDAGVHARGQVANMMIASRIPEAGLVRGLNALLPEEIRVLRAEEVPSGFDSRAAARAKEYSYLVALGEVVSPFVLPFALPARGRLQVDAMRAGARSFEGRHDFTSFCPAASPIEDKTRTILLSEVTQGGDLLEYRVRGDGFLHHMVRTMAGTLLLIGRGRLPADAIAGILEARDRRRAGPVAPARGLTLERVYYGAAS